MNVFYSQTKLFFRYIFSYAGEYIPKREKQVRENINIPNQHQNALIRTANSHTNALKYIGHHPYVRRCTGVNQLHLISGLLHELNSDFTRNIILLKFHESFSDAHSKLFPLAYCLCGVFSPSRVFFNNFVFVLVTNLACGLLLLLLCECFPPRS